MRDNSQQGLAECHRLTHTLSYNTQSHRFREMCRHPKRQVSTSERAAATRRQSPRQVSRPTERDSPRVSLNLPSFVRSIFPIDCISTDKAGWLSEVRLFIDIAFAPSLFVMSCHVMPYLSANRPEAPDAPNFFFSLFSPPSALSYGEFSKNNCGQIPSLFPVLFANCFDFMRRGSPPGSFFFFCCHRHMKNCDKSALPPVGLNMQMQDGRSNLRGQIKILDPFPVLPYTRGVASVSSTDITIGQGVLVEAERTKKTRVGKMPVDRCGCDVR